jgi:hypothetical protein
MRRRLELGANPSQHQSREQYGEMAQSAAIAPESQLPCTY